MIDTSLIVLMFYNHMITHLLWLIKRLAADMTIEMVIMGRKICTMAPYFTAFAHKYLPVIYYNAMLYVDICIMILSTFPIY